MSAISPAAPVFILLFLLLLAFPGQAIHGASDGLLLWFHTVLPTLAPAMICTRMLLLTGGDRLLMKPLCPLFRRLFSLSDTGSFILLSGMLCGYPLGPALCARALKENRISSEEASYLLAFCSFPSPMFLARYIPGQFPGPLSVGLLFFGIYIPVLLLSWIAGRRFSQEAPSGPPDSRNSEPPQTCGVSGHEITEKGSYLPDSSKTDSLDTVLYDVCDIMVLIGAYLMLFSIFARFLAHAAWIPAPAAAALCGILEMTTGIRQICGTFPAAVCLPACAASAAFGGISGVFQTRSVIGCGSCASQTAADFADAPDSGPAPDQRTRHKSLPNPLSNRKNAGFDIRHYVGWKLLHAGFSALILTVLQLVLPLEFPPHS